MAKSKNIVLLVFGLVTCLYLAGQSYLRDNIEETATSQLGVYEETGKNDGVMVERYLRSVGLSKGNPWCAAYVSWVLQQDCIPNPKSGWSPSWFPDSRTIYVRGTEKKGTPQKGDVFGIYFSSKKRVAHVGLILDWSGDYVVTIEGNTNEAGSREGDGVYKKRRLKRQIYAVSSWID